MLGGNQIARFLNKLYPQAKIDESIWFLVCIYRFKKHRRGFVNF